MKNNGVLLGEEYRLAHARTKKMNHLQLTVRDEIIKNDKPEDYESVPCICGNNEEYEVLSEVERHGLPYRKVICLKCGLLRVSPRWTKKRYDSFYETQYRDLYNPVTSSKEEHAKRLSLHPYMKDIGDWIVDSNKRFGRQKKSPRVIEIGAGGGWILQNLPTEWIRIGYDVDHDYLEIGKRLFNVEMKYGFLDEVYDEVKSSDIVILSHVVEHFLDPVESLRKINESMSHKSLLLIEVPGVFRIHYTNLDPMTYMQNAHTYTFCVSTLKYLCLLAGFEVLEINENCRVICMKTDTTRNQPVAMENKRISKLIIDYLVECERFYRNYSRVKKTKLLIPFAHLYKKLFIRRMDKHLLVNAKDLNN